MPITIDEAIEALGKERNDHHSYPTDIIGQAEGLGIQALKRVKFLQDPHHRPKEPLLPGQTEEVNHDNRPTV